MVPTQLIFVPMLFVLPPAIVPLVVVAALALDRLPDVAHRPAAPASACSASAATHGSRSARRSSSLLAGVDGPRWGDWPIYAARARRAVRGRAAQLDAARAARARRRADVCSLDVLREVWLVDALLAPVGLLAAFVERARSTTRICLVLPLALLLAIFARERRGRIGTAIELSATYRGTALLLGDVHLRGRRATRAATARSVVVLALAIADELHLDEDAAPARRVRARCCTTSARSRRRGDPPQAGPAERGGVGADARAHDRRPADARPRRRHAARRRAGRAVVARALRRRRLPRRARRRSRSRWRRGSSPSRPPTAR